MAIGEFVRRLATPCSPARMRALLCALLVGVFAAGGGITACSNPLDSRIPTPGPEDEEPDPDPNDQGTDFAPMIIVPGL